MNLIDYRLPLANGTWREGSLLQNGQCYGDIAPLPGFSRESLEEARAEARRVLRTGASPTLPSVCFAFACASTPLPPSLQVRTAMLDRPEPEGTVVKYKVGRLSLEETVALVAKIPKGFEIRLDFNRKWPLEKLLAFAKHFTPEAFDYLEEPTLSFADLLTFSKETGMPIAVDESILAIPYWEIPSLKAVVVKPTILGEIPFVPPGVDLIFTSAYESGIGLLHIANLAAKHSPEQVHGFDPYSFLQSDVLENRPVIANGFLTWMR